MPRGKPAGVVRRLVFGRLSAVPPPIPRATYRLQFSSEFQFHHAEKIVPYLQLLGISDIYASPIFKARSGSTHGYDIVDPRQLNPELGTDADFERLIQALHQQNMGWLQDIVPNHMAYSSQNPFLMDLMEHGPDSDYFDFFDVQWEHPYADIQGKILTPLLGDFYGNCLEKGELTLHYDETGLKIHYYDLKLPLRIESYTQLITHDIGRLARTLGRQHPDYIKLLGVLYMLKHAIAETAGQQRQDQVTFIKGLLWELHQTNDDIRSFIDHNVKLFNGDVNDPASFDLLDEMLSDQFFRLSYWKVGAEELNYRRFFTVNELISVNVQDREVFQTTHELIQTLVDEGKFTGVRIDHIDGLYNPQQYLEWLRDSLGDIYITVEKILESGEQLPSTWPIAGTSGYNFLNTVNRVFCQPQHGDDFTRIYQHYTGLYDDFETMAEEKKQVIAETNLAGDIENLANHLKSIARRYRYASDFTLNGLRRAITEVLVLFPVYRTYITPAGIADRDRAYVNQVMKTAKQRNPWLVNELDFIHKLVLLDYEDWLTTEEREQWEDFVLRLQQSSGPLTAKGIEDTALYVYNRFLSLNEVGGSPHQFGITVKQFHAHHRYQAEHWPHAMNASSTHDTKRSEDLRAQTIARAFVASVLVVVVTGLYLLDVASGSERLLMETASADWPLTPQIAWFADSRMLLSGRGDGQLLRIDTQNGEMLFDAMPHARHYAAVPARTGETVAYIDGIKRNVQLFHPATAGQRQMTRGLRVVPPLVWLP